MHKCSAIIDIVPIYHIKIAALYEHSLLNSRQKMRGGARQGGVAVGPGYVL